MTKTNLALVTATLVGGLMLGAGSASAAAPKGIATGDVPTSYVMMHKKKMMHHRMTMRHKMMRKKGL